jgi:PAS domain S-box-containing protein
MTDPARHGRPRSEYSVGPPIRWEPSIAFLKASIAFSLFGCAAFIAMLLTLYPGEPLRALIDLTLVIVAAAAWFLLARRRLNAALWTLGAGIWGYVTIASLFLGGVNSTVIMIYPVIILLSAWLVGVRVGMMFAYLTVAATFGFVILEKSGFLPAPFQTRPEMRWIVQAIVFMFTAVVISKIVHSYAGRLKEVGQLAADLTRRTAELEAIERDLRAAQAIANVGSWVYDFPTDSLRLSVEACRIFGLPEGATPGRDDFFSCIHAEDRGAVTEAWWAALRGDSPFDSEHRLQAGETVRWVRQLAKVERDADAAPLRAMGTVQDITARKEIENMKDSFIAVVSHELRTPLSSIVGSLGLLDGMTNLSADSKVLVRVARDNSRRLVRLLNDILDVEKLNSDVPKVALAPVELEALLDSCVRLNQGYADQFGVRLALTQSCGPAWVNANSDQLIQVMANLLSNAAKFSPRDASVEVRLERMHEVFRVSVIDSGPGIPEEFQPRVFDRFAQADSSVSRRRGGTGLGLAICKTIMDRLGGKIDFASTPGAGATFYFELSARAQVVREARDERRAARRT